MQHDCTIDDLHTNVVQGLGYATVAQSFEDQMNASVEDYVYWHVATIAPLSRLCVRYGNISLFKPTVTK